MQYTAEWAVQQYSVPNIADVVHAFELCLCKKCLSKQKVIVMDLLKKHKQNSFENVWTVFVIEKTSNCY